MYAHLLCKFTKHPLTSYYKSLVLKLIFHHSCLRYSAVQTILFFFKMEIDFTGKTALVTGAGKGEINHDLWHLVNQTVKYSLFGTANVYTDSLLITRQLMKPSFSPMK